MTDTQGRGADYMTVTEDMTPDELRKVAERRELVDKARRLAERRWARNQIAEAILAIPAHIVRQADAAGLLKGTLRAIVKAEADGEHITNGETHMAGLGSPRLDINWWQHATADHPKRSTDDALSRVEMNRGLPW